MVLCHLIWIRADRIHAELWNTTWQQDSLKTLLYFSYIRINRLILYYKKTELWISAFFANLLSLVIFSLSVDQVFRLDKFRRCSNKCNNIMSSWSAIRVEAAMRLGVRWFPRQTPGTRTLRPQSAMFEVSVISHHHRPVLLFLVKLVSVTGKSFSPEKYLKVQCLYVR